MRKTQKIIITGQPASYGSLLRWNRLEAEMNAAPVLDADRLSRWTGPHRVNCHRRGGTSSEGVSVSWAETVEQEESKTGGMEEWGVNNICHWHF